MKKLLFIIAFVFIGQQAFSQFYIVMTDDPTVGGCLTAEVTLTKVDPFGNKTNSCISKVADVGIVQLNLELNSIASLGYKLVETSYATSSLLDGGGYNQIYEGALFIFAIPWSASGLEEVPTTLKSFIISPNPANTFVDISLDYSLNGESEVVFISEAGYIAHKENINNFSKNEKYNIDISKIPAGKYLVTIVNGKTYTTPQKLIIF